MDNISQIILFGARATELESQWCHQVCADIGTTWEANQAFDTDLSLITTIPFMSFTPTQ